MKYLGSLLIETVLFVYNRMTYIFYRITENKV
jgi:hypothetical protein